MHAIARNIGSGTRQRNVQLPRVYYVANARMPTEKAHGLQIAKMCEAFIAQGVDVQLIVPTRGSDQRALREYYGLRADIPVIRLRVPDWFGSRAGFVVSSLLFAVRYFLYLRLRALRGESFIVYTTDLDQFSFFPIPFIGVPYAVEMHDAKRYAWPFPRLLRGAAAVIVVNDIIEAELADTFALPRHRIAVWPNGYDPRLFDAAEPQDAARRRLGLPADARIAMYVGRVYAWKGLEVLAGAARELPGVLVYLVGGTADDLRRIGIREQPHNLISAGARDHTEIPGWMRAADVLVVLGTARDEYSYRHTSPMKLFEYAAAGRPIVASRTPAIEAVMSEGDVFFAAPDDAADTAAAIRYVLDHPEEAAVRAGRARGRIVPWYDRAAHIRDFILTRV